MATLKSAQQHSQWQPPEAVSREDIIARSDAILAKADLPLRQTEDIFRIEALGLKGEPIGPDQYEVLRDTSMRLRYGTRTVARARPGTRFYDRMAAWPVAFELGMQDAMRRHFPANEYSIYLTGHSTGGPMVFM